MTAHLEADQVGYAYGRRAVLDAVSFAVAPGELVGVIGPNGAGKTTLVRLLAGVLAPSAGTVRLGGRPMKSYRRRDVARRLAVVPQDAHVQFPFTALEIVLMGRAAHLPRLGFPGARDLAVARAAMERLEVGHLEARPLDHVSGGERQRVLLSRALAQEPDTRGTAIVSVLHDLNLAAMYCDRLVLLADGRVARTGPPSEVLTADALGSAYRTSVYVGPNAATGSLVVLPRRPAR